MWKSRNYFIMTEYFYIIQDKLDSLYIGAHEISSF